MNRILFSSLFALVSLLSTTGWAGPKVVFLIGEREYDTHQTLPAFAKSELIPRGYECVFVHAKGDEGDARNEFPGIEAIDDADLLVVSTRRRTLKTKDLDRVRKHLSDGKPLVAIRTACHGFALRNGDPEPGYAVWPEFGEEILGVRYDGHLANDAASTYVPTDVDHAVMKQIPQEPIPSEGSLYRMYDLDPKAVLLLNGTTTDDGTAYTFPAAWLRTTNDGSRVFGSSIGHVSDFQKPAIRQLLVNACAWCVEDEKLAAAPSKASLAARYGFDPVEVFELDWRTFGLQSGDFNNDGRTDLAAVDNRKSRIALFLQKAEPTGRVTSDRPNALVDPGRFDQQSVLVDRAISSLAVGDVNGDGLVDLITMERPERLVVRLQTASGFEESQTIRIPDAGTAALDLAAADLEGDGDADVVVLGERETTLLESLGSDGLVARKSRLNTSDKLGMLQLVDIDGDDRIDWFYTAKDGSGSYVCYRPQLEQPLSFGPELRLTDDEFRAIALGELNERRGRDLVAIDAQTGRLEALSYAMAEGSNTDRLSDRVLQYGLSGGKQDRVAATGDFNGDGRPDLAVSSPEAAELILFVQGESGLETATLCPTLVGVNSLHCSDFNGDGRDELLVLSDDEASLGVAQWNDDKRALGFPEIITLPNGAIPVAVAVPEVVAEDQRGFVVARYLKGKPLALGTWVFESDAWTEKRVEPIPDWSGGEAKGVLQLDANGDSRTDFLFISREPPQLYVSNDAGELKRTSSGLSLPRVDRVGVSIAADELSVLVAQDRYVRRLSIDDSGSWQVQEQFNAPNSGVSFEAAVELPLGDANIAVCAFDVKEGRLFLFENGGTPTSIDVGSLPLQQMLVADLDGDGRKDIALVGSDRVALVRSAGQGPTLKTQLTYESDDERAHFADVIVGDINSDGRAELVVNETRQHTIAVVTPSWNAAEAEQALRFKLFEEKSFSSSRSQPGLQPREMLIADVTGDGRNDLIMLCHDRLLLHPQDAPASETD